jgi:hypothetical protein
LPRPPARSEKRVHGCEIPSLHLWDARKQERLLIFSRTVLRLQHETAAKESDRAPRESDPKGINKGRGQQSSGRKGAAGGVAREKNCPPRDDERSRRRAELKVQEDREMRALNSSLILPNRLRIGVT